jgi:NADPH-dependent glutamate synthase beta subunit-like oxidoreductase
MSEGGQILGSMRVRSLMDQDIALERLEPAWVRSDWDDVRVAMRTEGVYFAWNADDYPAEVVYGMVTGVPRAEYTSPTFMAVKFSISGPAS